MTSPAHNNVARHTLWNLAGMCLPMAVALVAIPPLIRGLGDARFGTLTIAWMLVGYFSIFDLGLGRALTKLVAEKLGAGRAGDIPGLFWTALATMFLVGVLAAGLVAALTPWMVRDLLKIAPELQAETIRALYVVAAGLPLVTGTVALIGVLQAFQRFKLINVIQIFTGSFTFLGPLCVLPFSRSLFAVVGVLVAGRLIEWLVYLGACLAAQPELRRRHGVSRAWLRPLFSLGGWMTISNLLVPLMNQVDRFIIGALISVAMVTFFVTPAEIVVKLLIFPRALVAVLFPVIAARFVMQPEAVGQLFGRSVKILQAALFLVVLAIVAVAPEALQLWLGGSFGAQSGPVMRWLAVGIYFSGLSYLPFILLQGVGRPDLPAWVHLVEFPLYLVLAWWLTRTYGLPGAAVAWVVRAAGDMAVMYLLGLRFVPAGRSAVRAAALGLLASLVLLVPAALPVPLAWRCAYGIVAAAVFAALAWFGIFSAEERTATRDLARRRWPRGA